MRQSTLEKRIKEGKKQPKEFLLGPTGTKVQFVDAPNDNYIAYLRFEDEYGRYLGALDPQRDRKVLRQLQRWVNKCLTGDSRG
jgi:DUF438 domain-containing protein